MLKRKQTRAEENSLSSIYSTSYPVNATVPGEKEVTKIIAEHVFLDHGWEETTAEESGSLRRRDTCEGTGIVVSVSESAARATRGPRKRREYEEVKNRRTILHWIVKDDTELDNRLFITNPKSMRSTTVLQSYHEIGTQEYTGWFPRVTRKRALRTNGMKMDRII